MVGFPNPQIWQERQKNCKHGCSRPFITRTAPVSDRLHLLQDHHAGNGVDACSGIGGNVPSCGTSDGLPNPAQFYTDELRILQAKSRLVQFLHQSYRLAAAVVSLDVRIAGRHDCCASKVLRHPRESSLVQFGHLLCLRTDNEQSWVALLYVAVERVD